MHLFDQFSTEQYIPLSHDNTYLFDHFDRVHNFIRSRIDRKYRDILAKPQKRNFDVEWYSVYQNLKKEENSFASQHYWQFKELLEKELEMLSSKTDADAKNWIDLLRKVFNAEDNMVYSNGENIAIIWGWKFENKENQRTEILLETSSPQQPFVEKTEILPFSPEVGEPKKNDDADVFQDKPIIEEESPEENEFISEDNPFEPLPEEDDADEQEKKGFLEFLKEFAAKYWWLLIVLLALIALVYFFKTAQL